MTPITYTPTELWGALRPHVVGHMLVLRLAGPKGEQVYEGPITNLACFDVAGEVRIRVEHCMLWMDPLDKWALCPFRTMHVPIGTPADLRSGRDHLPLRR